MVQPKTKGMTTIKKELEIYCEEHWWNWGSKTLSFKGTLKELLKKHGVTFTKRKTEKEGVFDFYFKNVHGISWKVRRSIEDIPHIAKVFIQMELVRMGDPSQLRVVGTFRSTVTVNR